MVRADDLDAVDRLMRHLDLPFDPNKWTTLYEQYGAHTLTAYFQLIAAEPPTPNTWAVENARWQAIREHQKTEQEIEVFTREHIHELHSKWTSTYTEEELYWLEDYYNQIVATQNVSTPILQAAAQDLCELELCIRRGLRNGEDVKKYLDARDNMIKVYGFSASNSKNAADFDSVGELAVYLIKKGWQPTYHTEPKDSIDFIMQNNQDYLRRLYQGEGGIGDQIDSKREQFNTAERLESGDEEVVELEYEDDVEVDET